MLSSLFPFLYCIALIVLLWQAFRVMSRGFSTDQTNFPSRTKSLASLNDDRTGRLTVHPELLDKEGRITDEELLTVRFSGDADHDPPQSAKKSAE